MPSGFMRMARRRPRRVEPIFRFRAMTGYRAAASALALAASVAGWGFMTTPYARGQDAEVAEAQRFDLPAQPLADLLRAFYATRLVVVAPKPLIDGRVSAPVHGTYAPADALRMALAGTGLRVNVVGADQAVVEPDDAAPPARPQSTTNITDGALDGGDYRPYIAMIQANLTTALCASPLTRPGDYRLAAQLLIDRGGKVAMVDLLASTGMPARDAAIGRALRALTLDVPPPAGFPQPVTILLRPAGNGIHADCPAAEQEAR
ncbi:secretin and TonB N-terminal domain-containing protein [Burkholderia anthina]|uniref:secretin and TonB N-terminal domain-containing protein n=1 Tax=Burkholderia anthina TaxID=179879 RepID=UPI001FC8E971|nr:secretin and TonB N-terminal domain-containing protein [Burkholderia anthina]